MAQKLGFFSNLQHMHNDHELKKKLDFNCIETSREIIYHDWLK